MLVAPGSQLVFQRVFTTSFEPHESDPGLNDWLGKANELKLVVITDRVSGNSGNLRVGISVEETADEEAPWIQSSYSLIDIDTSDVSVTSAVDTDSQRGRPGLAFRRIVVTTTSDAGPYSARVRVWATGRNGYRNLHRLLFRGAINGTSPLYVGEACTWPVDVDALAVTLLLENSSTGTDSVVVQAEESPNGKVWRTANMQMFPDGGGLDGLVVYGFTPDALPYGGRLRFLVQGSGPAPAADARLWVTGREIRRI